MQKSLGDFETTLHAAGKCLGVILGAVGERDAAEHLIHAFRKGSAADAVEVSDVAKVLLGCKFYVDAGGLEYDADLATNAVGISRDVESADSGSAAGWEHQ